MEDVADGARTTVRGDATARDGFEAVLRAAGHRVTEPRRAVHAALVDSDGHVTAEEVVAASGGDVNLATVYRVLGLLEELGVARSARLGSDGSASWELAHPDDHFHLVCVRCGEVDHHVGDAVDHLRRHLLDGHGFQADEVDLVVRGVCASCRGVADEVVPPSQPADVSAPDLAPRGR
ncbi:Fur family transcriptional regulator [Salsipaludibacter albus]|uniref:Fur family transcriptional regulator n=1 Tax=Salsipaludibacter albus TaxID=2849650 RepID=UPI001EE42165|nr:transcriptional repressor [Salsipaludibacter albus]